MTGAEVPVEVLGNIGYIRRLWDAFRSGGPAAMAELVPADVAWRPLAADGHCLPGHGGARGILVIP